MTSLTPTQSARGAPARELALGAYVVRARGWCLERAADELGESVSLRLGDRALTLHRTEFTSMLNAAGPGDDSCAPGEMLGLEILGLLTKSFEDLASLRAATKPSSKSVLTLQAELVLDCAIGTALLADSQRLINAVLARGERDQAEPLARLRKRLQELVAEVGRTIAASERERAAVLAGSFTTQSLDQGIACKLDFEETTPAEAAAKRLFRASPHDESRLELSADTILGAALLFVLLVWLGVFVLPGLRQPSFRLLAADDFASQEILRRIDARPPSLFARVDTVNWTALDAGGRRDFLDGAARILERHGYSGAFFETEQGVPVAQWLEERGAELIADREPAAY